MSGCKAVCFRVEHSQLSVVPANASIANPVPEPNTTRTQVKSAA